MNTRREFDPESFIRIAADNIQSLRKCDVYRILECADMACQIESVSSYILANRPEFTGEVEECLSDLASVDS